jgi:hypothetical protein
MLKFNKHILTILGGMVQMAGIQLHQKLVLSTNVSCDQ